MDPLTIIAALNALATLAPKLYELAAQAKSVASASDAASIDAALQAAQKAASVDLDQALTDLDNAAKN